MVLGKTKFQHKHNKQKVHFLKIWVASWDYPFSLFASVQRKTDLGATRHASIFKYLLTVLGKTDLEPNISRALFVVFVYGPWRNRVPA